MTNLACKLGMVTMAVLALMTHPASALSIGIGGDDGIGVDIGRGDDGGLGVGVDVGGDDGIGVDVGVGGGNGVGAGVSVGDAVDADVSIGGRPSGASPGTPGGTPGTGPSATVSSASMPGRAEVAKARRLVCRNDGNSEVYADYLVFDRSGRPVGVVASAWVGPDLKIDRLRFATLDSFASPAKCLTVSGDGARVGQGAIGLPYAGNDLQKAIARR